MGASDVLTISRIGNARSMRRAVTASVLGTIKKEDPERVLRKCWSRDEGARQIITRAAVSPTSTGDYPHIDLVGSFVSFAPGSAALKLFDASTKLDLSGITTISVPNLATLPPRPPFVGEGLPAPSVQLAFAKTVLGPARKVLILAALTKEVEEATPESASEVIGRVLADASSASIDRCAFDANPADATRPAGLLHGVVPIAASAETIKTEAMEEDLANLAAAVAAAGIDPSDLIYVAGAREATLLRLRTGESFENEVLVTLGLPAKSVAAFAPAATYSGYQGLPTIETASDMVVHAEDTNPLPLVSGSPGVVAAPSKSLWQTECIAIRVRAWAAWAVAVGGAQIINNVAW
jgi:hypothetical protein